MPEKHLLPDIGSIPNKRNSARHPLGHIALTGLLLMLFLLLLTSCAEAAAPSDQEDSASSDDQVADTLSGGDSELASPAEPEQSGSDRIYVGTGDGGVYLYDPTANAGGDFWRDDELGAVIDLAPGPADSMIATMRHPLTGAVSNQRIANGAASTFDSAGIERLICFDNHPSGDSLVAHDLTPLVTDRREHRYRPVIVDGGRATDLGGHERNVHTACPRWNSDRTFVASAQYPDPAVGTHLELLIEGPDGPFAASLPDCSLVPQGFSPDDLLLAVAATCDQGTGSGLYLLDMSGPTLPSQPISQIVVTFAAWSPDGRSLAVTGATQLPASGALLTSDLMLVKVETGATTVISLPPEVNPHVVTWLENPA